MNELLQRLSIELVLTAHPTEARRRTVLSKIDISDAPSSKSANRIFHNASAMS